MEMEDFVSLAKQEQHNLELLYQNWCISQREAHVQAWKEIKECSARRTDTGRMGDGERKGKKWDDLIKLNY